MSHLAAVKQAKEFWEAREANAGRFSDKREARVNNAIALAEWGVFSNNQISTFTDVEAAKVGEYSRKTDRTGGSLTGESLAPIIDIIVARTTGDAGSKETRNAIASGVRRAVDAGASTRMISRLSGVPQRTVARYGEVAA